jgi:hypothetical protein
MKSLLLLPLFFALNAAAQKKEKVTPRFDTLAAHKVIFTDEWGIKYETFRSQNGYTSIVKDGKQRRLIQDEKPLKPGAEEFATIKQ